MATTRESRDSGRYRAAREDIVNINNRIEREAGRLETMNRRMDGVPRRMENIEQDYYDSNPEFERLRHGHRIHELKLDLLEKQVNNVRLNNELMLDHIRSADQNKDADSPREDGRPGDVTDRSSDCNRIDLPADNSAAQTPRHETPPPSRRKDTKDYRQVSRSSIRSEMSPEEKERERLRRIYGIHDSTGINPQNWQMQPKHRHYPWFDHKTLLEPGGIVFLRFDDSAYEEVKIALRSPQQAICRHSGGYILGAARKQRIVIYEDAPGRILNWNFSRNRECPTENSIVAFWFSKKSSAEQFFENGHHNKLRDPLWPTANGYDAAYIPLNCAPPMDSSYKTFFVVEFLDAWKYSAEDMTGFESEARTDMCCEVPGCLPMVISCQSGKVIFKPGAFINPRSKVYVSRFQSQRDVDRIWSIGLIQGLRYKWNMPGTINAFSFTIEDML